MVSRYGSPHLRIAFWAVLGLHPFQPIEAQGLPKLRGYQLGISQSEARASRLPCRPVDKPVLYLECDAPNNVQLNFYRDTLVSISLDFDRQPTAARARWFAVSDSLATLYGDPDSVRVKDDAVGTVLTAYWGPLTPSKPWGFTYNAFEIRLGDIVTSGASFTLFVCFWEDQHPLCAAVLKGLSRGKRP